MAYPAFPPSEVLATMSREKAAAAFSYTQLDEANFGPIRHHLGTHPIPRQRASYSQSFKMEVVRTALSLPPTARIKPTSRVYPGIEPAQIRRWIRTFGPMVAATMRPVGSNPNDLPMPVGAEPPMPGQMQMAYAPQPAMQAPMVLQGPGGQLFAAAPMPAAGQPAMMMAPQMVAGPGGQMFMAVPGGAAPPGAMIDFSGGNSPPPQLAPGMPPPQAFMINGQIHYATVPQHYLQAQAHPPSTGYFPQMQQPAQSANLPMPSDGGASAVPSMQFNQAGASEPEIPPLYAPEVKPTVHAAQAPGAAGSSVVVSTHPVDTNVAVGGSSSGSHTPTMMLEGLAAPPEAPPTPTATRSSAGVEPVLASPAPAPSGIKAPTITASVGPSVNNNNSSEPNKPQPVLATSATALVAPPIPASSLPTSSLVAPPAPVLPSPSTD